MLLNRQYDFDTQLASLRGLVNAARMNSNQLPTHKQCVPLIIHIQDILDELGYGPVEAREIRIKLYCLFTESNIESTYDLPLSVLRTINSYLDHLGQEGAASFVEESAARVTHADFSPEKYPVYSPGTADQPADMPDMWEPTPDWRDA